MLENLYFLGVFEGFSFEDWLTKVDALRAWRVQPQCTNFIRLNRFDVPSEKAFKRPTSTWDR